MLRDKIYRKKQLETTIKLKNEIINWMRSKVSSPTWDKPRVQGGFPPDQLKKIIMIQRIENDIKEAKEELEILNPFIREELEILNEYEPLTKKIIELRELHKMTWEKIAEATYYSRRQCINIYNKKFRYKK